MTKWPVASRRIFCQMGRMQIIIHHYGFWFYLTNTMNRKYVLNSIKFRSETKKLLT